MQWDSVLILCANGFLFILVLILYFCVFSVPRDGLSGLPVCFSAHAKYLHRETLC